jgi:hypothetical protein
MKHFLLAKGFKNDIIVIEMQRPGAVCGGNGTRRNDNGDTPAVTAV